MVTQNEILEAFLQDKPLYDKDANTYEVRRLSKNKYGQFCYQLKLIKISPLPRKYRRSVLHVGDYKNCCIGSIHNLNSHLYRSIDEALNTTMVLSVRDLIQSSDD